MLGGEALLLMRHEPGEPRTIEDAIGHADPSAQADECHPRQHGGFDGAARPDCARRDRAVRAGGRTGSGQ
jgi:hypothetical protein